MFASGIKTLAAAFTAVAATLSVATAAQAQLSGSIDIDGSSTVYPVTEAMAEEFRKTTPGVNITVGVSGTGGGFRKFCNGETVISNASRPIRDTEVAACAANNVQYTEIQVGVDALAVVVASNTRIFGAEGTVPAAGMTIDQLKTLWEPAAEGRIRRWNQLDRQWARNPISLFGPGTDSGTFDYFTEEVMGEVAASRADYTASEDDNILVVGVSRSPYALGYFGLAYYLENQNILRSVPVNGVSATFENAASGAYPLARPLFIYVRNDGLQRPEVRAFVKFYLETSRDTTLVREVGYVAMPANNYTTILSRLGL
ncbi:PstS family phosphate ABC transporter substrate-binding protein [Leptolyngbya sp. PCC 6406]|uniref:PstS family phosphate ABC transporter substrate-binding protein n=1 Tax=Leptolyngbya sp. PCC 6406 TaxID=1173264 RepID=UPI0002ACE9D9|nr:PstS family phosphate ABC transporter substrate-binding protein [Leptolyngbya sp. PCC 6406]